MNYKRSTQVPNILFDVHLPHLKESELKILLIIIRQTYGWIRSDGKRKEKDQISYGQFIKKTGLSRRIISDAIQSLIDYRIIHVRNYNGGLLTDPKQRKGKAMLYYSPNF